MMIGHVFNQHDTIQVSPPDPESGCQNMMKRLSTSYISNHEEFTFSRHHTLAPRLFIIYRVASRQSFAPVDKSCLKLAEAKIAGRDDTLYDYVFNHSIRPPNIRDFIISWTSSAVKDDGKVIFLWCKARESESVSDCFSHRTTKY